MCVVLYGSSNYFFFLNTNWFSIIGGDQYFFSVFVVGGGGGVTDEIFVLTLKKNRHLSRFGNLATTKIYIIFFLFTKMVWTGSQRHELWKKKKITLLLVPNWNNGVLLFNDTTHTHTHTCSKLQGIIREILSIDTTYQMCLLKQ